MTAFRHSPDRRWRRGLAIGLALGVSLAAAISASANAQVTLDVRQAGHIISPQLFGDWIEWTGLGQDLIQAAAFDPDTGTVRADVINQLKPAGVTLLRYPGGILNDLFHWAEAVGPWPGRVSQYTLFPDNSAVPPLQKQRPVFGPDEFAGVAKSLNAEILVSANVGTGTASEAGAWLAHYQAQGVRTAYWEIGNENYLDSADTVNAWAIHQAYRTAPAYAGIFDAYASALRAVDPTAKVGMVGCHNFGPDCPTWNQTVLTSIHQRADFLAVHNCYYPMAYIGFNGIGADDAYRAMLASPLDIQASFDLLEADITNYAGTTSPNLVLAETEHSSYWEVPTGVGDSTSVYAYLNENQTLGSALFSALTYQVLFSRPRVQIATHTNMLTPFYQGLLTMAPLDLSNSPVSYPAGYVPNPVPSAYYYVFRLYRQAAGGAYIPVTVTASPTYDSVNFQFILPHTAVPSLDAAAVRAASPANRILLYVVNRDLTRSVPSQVNLRGLTQPVSALSAQTVNAANYRDKNSAAQPNAIQFQTQTLAPQTTFSYTFPAHSLTCFTADQAAPTPTSALPSGLVMYPNPFHAGSQAAVTFTHLAPGGTFKVFNVAGELIFSAQADASGNAGWDGMIGGRRAAAGIYLVLGEGPAGKVKSKLAIQP